MSNMREKFPLELVFVAIAAMGGIARYLSLFLNGEKFRLSMFFANLIVSGFAGLMFALFGRSMAMSLEMQWVLSGVGGFMGTEAMKFLIAKIKKI